jgi:hypothetical protein
LEKATAEIKRLKALIQARMFDAPSGLSSSAGMYDKWTPPIETGGPKPCPPITSCAALPDDEAKPVKRKPIDYPRDGSIV